MVDFLAEDVELCLIFFFWAGPGTVMCDYMSYVFMFLSIATSNMVATSIAKEVSSSYEFR